MKKLLILLFVVQGAFNTLFAEDVNGSEVFKEKIQQAMQSDTRTEQEVERDENRLPAETLEFFGLKDDMTVIELIPGGGWYTKILAPVLAEKGKFYISIATSRAEKNVLSMKEYESAKVLSVKNGLKRDGTSRFYTIDPFEFDVHDVDRVFTFRNYHNLTEEGRGNINKAVFNALKPGGIYAVVDHTRRHMQPLNEENGRRVDPVQAIKEIERAGFEFVDYSTLHYHPDDELLYEVGRKTVTGNTDRFTFKFRKPL